MVVKLQATTKSHQSSNEPTGTEQQRFSARLKIALMNAGIQADSPSVLAGEFNSRFPSHTITVHAARKWMLGEAIPTQVKLVVLSQWLGVSPAWLRFGEGCVHVPDRVGAVTMGLSLMDDLQRLDDKQKLIAREFIRLLLHSAARIG